MRHLLTPTPVGGHVPEATAASPLGGPLMLALLRLQPPPRSRHLARCHDVLPPDSSGIVGAAIRCNSLDEVESAPQWRLNGSRPGVVLRLALVVPRDAEITRRIALERSLPRGCSSKTR